MRTVREVSHLVGLSVRTLHYYDAIGLLKPTHVAQNGYRYYDDRALDRLQEILLFRELVSHPIRYNIVANIANLLSFLKVL